MCTTPRTPSAPLRRRPFAHTTALAAGLALSLTLTPGITGAETEAPARPAAGRSDAALIELESTYVTATRSETGAFRSPFAQHLVDTEQLFRKQYRTTPEALRDIPGVMVQKTAFGHGSPYIRGFTSFRNLFLIDGIRLNGPHFRPGPNQYWNTVDPGMIDRIELVKGPASVAWGSDGIGGTVNAITRRPAFEPGERPWRATTTTRFSTAERSFIGRQQFSGRLGDRIRFLGGFGGKVFGDLDTGGALQEGTDYDEWNGDFKLEFDLEENVRLVGAYQGLRQNNVPRTHKTVDAEPFRGTTVGTELQRELDQERELIYMQLIGEDLDGFVDAYRASLSWQRQEETRDRLRPGSNPGDPPRRDMQGFEVGTLGFFTHLESRTPLGRWTYGVDFYHSNVNSFRTGSDIQGPLGDDATTQQLGLFVQNQFSLGDRLHMTLGGRFNHARVDADSVEDPVTGGRIGVEDDWQSFVGSARATYELAPETWSLFGGVSQGFRAPNLGDLTRFDTARTDEFEIPAPGLDEEAYLTFEIGTKLRHERASLQLSYFYTDIDDQILRFPTGNTNSAGETEVTKANVGDGQVFGVELAWAWDLAPAWTFFGNASYVEGEVTNFVGPPGNLRLEEEYLSRLMPPTALLGVRWQPPEATYWVESALRVAGDADKLSTRDRGDTQRIPPGGTPGYAVWDLRAGWDVNPNLSVVAALENVTDENFRIHGSGQNEPGANFILSVRATY